MTWLKMGVFESSSPRPESVHSGDGVQLIQGGGRQLELAASSVHRHAVWNGRHNISYRVSRVTRGGCLD
jgi:hypothetical protein